MVSRTVTIGNDENNGTERERLLGELQKLHHPAPMWLAPVKNLWVIQIPYIWKRIIQIYFHSLVVDLAKQEKWKYQKRR